MTGRSVMWFRRDLRIDDHPALAEASAAGEVVALFVVDPAFATAGRARQTMLLRSLHALREATGGGLVIRAGDPALVVPTVAAEVDADSVFVSRDFSPYGRRRDGVVAEALRANGRRLRGIGSPYAVEPGTIVKPDGSGYAVFTAFAKRWRDQAVVIPVAPPAEPNWVELAGEQISDMPDETGDLAADWSERWAKFCGESLADYRTLRNQPAIDGTSRMSVALKFGMVHPRRLLADLDPSDADHQAFATELAWRDFYGDVLFRRPETVWRNLDRRFDAIAVDRGPEADARFDRWCTGTTGFPLVDAGIRQLLATGWMHNRVRMVVASFLVKDLHLDWQRGARFFMRHLADGDLASNSHGWQWAAGCGTDAAPYFRVFNPAAQQERFDPDGEYVARWIPEVGTSGYPAPIVDHAAERVEALARYTAVAGATR